MRGDLSGWSFIHKGRPPAGAELAMTALTANGRNFVR